MEYAGARNVVLCAPITEHYFTRRPLLIQSIPKCGTHLLFEVAKAMGYGPPPSLDLPEFAEELLPGHFYNLQHLRFESLGQPYARLWRFAEAFAASPFPSSTAIPATSRYRWRITSSSRRTTICFPPIWNRCRPTTPVGSH